VAERYWGETYVSKNAGRLGCAQHQNWNRRHKLSYAKLLRVRVTSRSVKCIIIHSELEKLKWASGLGSGSTSTSSAGLAA